jgi:uncharacterized protein YjbJ (UPF0337 family)
LEAPGPHGALSGKGRDEDIPPPTGSSLYHLELEFDHYKGTHMNWDQIEGKWKQLTGSAREHWGKITEEDWQSVAGKKDQLVGRFQERYGLAKAAAEKSADAWSRSLKEI